MGDPTFSTVAHGVFSNLKSNSAYPEAADIVTAADPILVSFDTATQKARDTRDRNWFIKRDDCRNKIMTTLDHLADLAQYKTPNNAALLSTTGFELTGQPKPAPDMPKPEGFTVEFTQASGQVICKVPANKKCKSYLFEFIQLPNPENNWSNVVGTKSRAMISDLTPGSQYSFRCAYVGTKGQGSWSDMITRFMS